MSIKIGDKVRFLNDVGGGVVTAVNGLHEVIVEQEDGFGFPVAVSQCVVINEVSATMTPKPQPKAVVKPSVAAKPAPVVVTSSAAMAIQKSFSAASADELNLSLAFVLEDEELSSDSKFQIYVVNDSYYTLQFSLLGCSESSAKLYNSGQVAPQQSYFIEEIGVSQLSKVENLRFQAFAYKSFGAFKSHAPINERLIISGVKFYKRASFAKNSYFNRDAMLVKLSAAEEQSSDYNISTAELGQLFARETKADKAVTNAAKVLKNTTPEIIEVDLHIGKLLDSIAGMSNRDMFEYQMEHFRKVLRENEKHRGQKIVFIHGKGDGVLRKAIESHLKKVGLGNRYQEASFKKYGFGALLVTM